MWSKILSFLPKSLGSIAGWITLIPELWDAIKKVAAWASGLWESYQEQKRKEDLARALDKAEKTKDQRDLERHFNPEKRYDQTPGARPVEPSPPGQL